MVVSKGHFGLAFGIPILSVFGCLGKSCCMALVPVCDESILCDFHCWNKINAHTSNPIKRKLLHFAKEGLNATWPLDERSCIWLNYVHATQLSHGKMPHLTHEEYQCYSPVSHEDRPDLTRVYMLLVSRRSRIWLRLKCCSNCCVQYWESSWLCWKWSLFLWSLGSWAESSLGQISGGSARGTQAPCSPQCKKCNI